MLSSERSLSWALCWARKKRDMVPERCTLVGDETYNALSEERTVKRGTIYNLKVWPRGRGWPCDTVIGTMLR